MAGQDVDRGDFAGFVIRDDVHDGDAFSRASQAFAFIQRVMLGLAGTHWAGTSFFRCVLEGWRKKESTFIA